jgi:hypothetical protein
LYLLWIPLAAYFLLSLKQYFFKKEIFYIVLTAVILALGFYSLKIVILDPVHGLRSLKNTLKEMRSKANQAQLLTDENSIIIAGKSDKIFFPERRVISLDLDNEKVRELVKNYSDSLSFYYYSTSLEKIKYLNKNILKKDNLILTERQELYPGEFLCQIKLLNSSGS